VPTTPLTLTDTADIIDVDETERAPIRHARAVADVHVLVLHVPAEVINTVAVETADPKLNPLIVSVAPALHAALAGVWPLTTGAARK
jgi:hypothetical protein